MFQEIKANVKSQELKQSVEILSTLEKKLIEILPTCEHKNPTCEHNNIDTYFERCDDCGKVFAS